MSTTSILQNRGLIVSAQALEGESLYDGDAMRKMAVAVESAGTTYVVVGNAITRPQLIAARFTAAVHARLQTEMFPDG
ncbi:hypothetical protein ACE41H_17840 [Paenibacillus enshidis]|uniref:Uncharacterized protein n=1 Tax=Paenibacillus enshidis TaxID=1458439 RepID=A0ABV5AWN7_9BACL